MNTNSSASRRLFRLWWVLELLGTAGIVAVVFHPQISVPSDPIWLRTAGSFGVSLLLCCWFFALLLVPLLPNSLSDQSENETVLRLPNWMKFATVSMMGAAAIATVVFVFLAHS